MRDEIPFRFDQRHTVNIVFNYQLNKWLDLGVRWQYGSGFPYSQPGGIKPRIVLFDNDADGIPETPQIATRKNNSNSELQEIIYDIDYDNSRLNARNLIGWISVYCFTNLEPGLAFIWTINVYNRKMLLLMIIT
jgi:hypothetical protein